MPTTLPVPLEFRLPEGWLPARPEGFNVADVAFAAVHSQPDAGFAANITIDGDVPPALAQRLVFSTVVDGAHRGLVQSQVYLSLSDVKNSHKRAVIRLTLTATAGQHDAILGDFQDFVRTVVPDTGTAA
ncbi:hypothetical protein [Streptomyces sp. NPDC000877]|uniref:hypothetical protein n=1 Tax=unclassified Streptomyces TaxID=2593676 RepID=UPI0033291135